MTAFGVCTVTFPELYLGTVTSAEGSPALQCFTFLSNSDHPRPLPSAGTAAPPAQLSSFRFCPLVCCPKHARKYWAGLEAELQGYDPPSWKSEAPIITLDYGTSTCVASAWWLCLLLWELAIQIFSKCSLKSRYFISTISSSSTKPVSQRRKLAWFDRICSSKFPAGCFFSPYCPLATYKLIVS